MQKYVTHPANCQYLFYEIISADDLNRKSLMNLIHRFHRALKIFAYFFRHVNKFAGFQGCYFRPLTCAAEPLSDLLTANCAVTACFGSKQALRFGMT